MPVKAGPICHKSSCVHFHREGWRGRCKLGLKFSDPCPGYTPRARRTTTWCNGRWTCVHFYREDWRPRCRLGLKHKAGRCPEYTPRQAWESSREAK